MLILWIRRKKTDQKNNPGKDKKQLFLNHDEYMKKFRALHPNTDALSADDILARDGNSLVPVHQVKLNENIQN